MTPGGWITMLVSVGFVTGLLTWCVVRVLCTSGAAERLRAPADVEPGDVDADRPRTP